MATMKPHASPRLYCQQCKTTREGDDWIPTGAGIPIVTCRFCLYPRTDPQANARSARRCTCIHDGTRHDPDTGVCLADNPTFGPCPCEQVV